MVERARTAAETGIAGDRAMHESLRLFDRFRQRYAFGEISGYGGGVGTSGAVGVGRRNAGGGETVDAAFMKEKVERVAREMAAFDQDGVCAEAGKGSGRALHRGGGIDGEAAEGFGLREIRHEQRGVGDQVSEEGGGGVGGREVCAVFGQQDGIDNEREVPTGCGGAERFDQFETAQGAGLGGGRRHIVEEGIDLLEHEFGGEAFDAGKGAGVLDGEEADNSFTVGAELVEGLEIGLDTGPS